MKKVEITDDTGNKIKVDIQKFRNKINNLYEQK